MEEKIRAIYKRDLMYDNCPVFELNKQKKQFIMISDDRFRYHEEDVFEDDNFYVFKLMIKNDELENINEIK